MKTKRNKIIAVINKLLEWSLYLIIFALPFSKSVVEICVAVGIALFITKRILTKDYRLPGTPANMALLFVFLTAALSLINSEFMKLSIRALFAKNLKFIALYFLVVDTIDDRVKMMNLLKMGLVSAVIVFIDVFIQQFLTYVDVLHNYPAFKYHFYYNARDKVVDYCFKTYPTGPFPFPNDLSAWLLIVVPVLLCVSLLDLKDKLSRYLIIAVSFVGLYIFVQAKVRGAWLAFILAISSTLFLARSKTVIILVLIALLGLILICFVKTPDVVFGLSTVLDRGEMWNNGLKIFKEHPVIGNGINTFFNKYRYTRQDADRGRGSYAHNCYLQMASDVGILGLAAFLWFVFAIFKSAVSFIRSTRDEFRYALVLGLALGIGAFLLHSAVDTNLYSLNLASLFWLTAGFVVSACNMKGPDSA